MNRTGLDVRSMGEVGFVPWIGGKFGTVRSESSADLL